MSFTPYTSLLGGLILSGSTSALLTSYGRVFGVSGITHTVLDEAKPDSPGRRVTEWKWSTFAGLIAGGAVLRLAESSLIQLVGAPVFDHSAQLGGSLTRTIIAGLLVGAGTRVSCS